MRIPGRSTKMGALTMAKKVEGNIKINETNFSRTGNHWDIIITGTGVVDIIDISNTQKHYCRRIKIRDNEPIETILKPEVSYWTECPICKKE